MGRYRGLGESEFDEMRQADFRTAYLVCSWRLITLNLGKNVHQFEDSEQRAQLSKFSCGGGIQILQGIERTAGSSKLPTEVDLSPKMYVNEDLERPVTNHTFSSARSFASMGISEPQRVFTSMGGREGACWGPHCSWLSRSNVAHLKRRYLT